MKAPHPPRSLLVMLFALLLLTLPLAPASVHGDPPAPTVKPTRPQRPRPVASPKVTLPQFSPGIEEVGRLGGEGSYQTLDQSGSQLYVGTQTGLIIFDIGGDGRLTRLGSYDLPGRAVEIHVQDRRAYITTANFGPSSFETGPFSLNIFDIGNPSQPILLNTYTLDNESATFAATGTRVFDVSYERGLQILDVADPAMPKVVGRYNRYGTYQDVDAVGDLVFIASYSGLLILDTSNPISPTLRGSYPTFPPPANPYPGPGDPPIIRQEFTTVEVVGTTVYALSLGALEIIDVSNPAKPVLQGSFSFAQNEFFRGRRNIQVVDKLVFVYSGGGGLSIIDVSSPARPIRRSRYAISLLDFTATPSTIYAIDGDEGLALIDITNPARAFFRTRYNLPQLVGDVFVDDNIAYLAGNAPSLTIADISNSTRPIPTSSIATSQYAKSVFVAGGLAYVCELSKLLIYDVGDVRNPVLRSTYPSNCSNAVTAQGNIAYLTGNNGLEIINVSTPTSPVRFAELTQLQFSYDVEVVDGYAYVAEGNGMAIVDVRDPSRPFVVGRYDIGVPGTAIQLRGTLAFLVNSYGLDIIDVSDPRNPTFVGYYDLPRPIYSGVNFYVNNYDVEVKDELVYVGYNGAGLYIFDISDPTKPVLRAGYGKPISGLALANDLVYVGGQGLRILRVYPERFDYSVLYLPYVRR